MTPDDKNQIRNWASARGADAEFTFFFTGNEIDEPFETFCNQFSDLAPRVTIRKKSLEEKDPSPAFQLLPNLVFQAIPNDTKLPPFLQSIEGERPRLPPQTKEILVALHTPVFLKLYIARQCPFCPKTMADFVPLAGASPYLHLNVIEADRFPELAQKDKIQSVPTLILDDEFRWTGAIPVQEVTAMLADRDPARLSAAALEQMIKEGNAARLAEMMVEHGKIFPALIELLTHPKWPSRLGSMVVAETLADEAPLLARKLTPLLWEKFPHADSSVKGDILYVVGAAGGDSALEILQSVLESNEDSDVKEAAEEALDAL